MAAVNSGKVIQARHTVETNNGGCFRCCKTKNSIQVPITVRMPEEEGWCGSISNNKKKFAAALVGGVVAGAGIIMAFLGSGSTTAAAMAGFASGAMSTSADSGLDGSGNVQAGSGGNSLFSFNSISTSSLPETATADEKAARATMEKKLECMKQGMTLVNPSDGSLLSWDTVTSHVKCKTDFVQPKDGTRSEMLKGICTHAHVYSATRNRRDLSAAEAPAPAPALVLVPTSDPYQGRVGNQMEWPLQDEDYTAFNLALLTGGVLLINGVRYWVVSPMCSAIRAYLSSDG